MKRVLFILTLLLSALLAKGQSVIFLHHSTGEGVYVEGNVAAWIANYNSTHGKSYSITEWNFPNTPYPWQNYPYDYWYLWVNNQCSSTNANIYCMSKLVQLYDVIIFKHCFPGASIVADNGNPLVNSPIQTIANYQLQYRALRALMDQYPQKKFIIWTLAPLHRLATNSGDAARARQFVNWVKTTWLTEDGKSHPNIYIFDFFNLIAEASATPANGQTNCLKYEYEKSHSDSDSHPNITANQTVGPVFAQFIVNTIENSASAISKLNDIALKIKIYPNPVKDKVTFDFSQIDEPVLSIDIFSCEGKRFLSKNIDADCQTILNTGNLPSGIYVVRINTISGTAVRLFSKI